MMLLTILIPTRNRAARLRPLVASLIANLPAARRDDIEIVVLDNCSEQPAEELLRPHACPMLRIITNPAPLPTSEENVLNGIGYARGQYVWFLGDDDLPRYAAVAAMIEQVAAGSADLFVSNFRIIDGKGRLASLSQIRGAPVDIQASLVSIVKRIGIINVLSGWSIIVARRDMLDVAVAREIMATGVIYSHCFWFLECFARGQVTFLSKPLVDYRVFHHADGWQQYTTDRDVGYLHYWHLGLIRHYRRAMTRGLLTASDIAETFEYRHNGTRYRGIDEIVYKLVEQADMYVHTGLARNLLTREQLFEATSWLLEIDLSLQDALIAIEAMYEPLWKGGNDTAALDAVTSSRNDAIELIEARARDLFAPFFVAFVYGYTIFRYNDVWIAIRSDAMALVDAVFAQLEPRSMAPGVLVEGTERALYNALKRAPAWPEPVGERPSLVSMALLDEVQAVGKGTSLLGQLSHQMLTAADQEAAANGHSGVRHLWLASAGYRRASQPAAMATGWSGPEPDGIWSLGTRSEIALAVPVGAATLCIEAHAFAPGGRRRFGIGIDAPREFFLDGEVTVIRLPVSEASTVSQLEISTSTVGAPADHGGSTDSRPLGLFVHRIWTEEEHRPVAKRRAGRWYRWLKRRLP